MKRLKIDRIPTTLLLPGKLPRKAKKQWRKWIENNFRKTTPTREAFNRIRIWWDNAHGWSAEYINRPH